MSTEPTFCQCELCKRIENKYAPKKEKQND